MKNLRNIGIVLIFVCTPVAFIDALINKEQNLFLYFLLNAVMMPIFLAALVCITVAYIQQKRKDASD